MRKMTVMRWTMSGVEIYGDEMIDEEDIKQEDTR